MDTVPDRKFYLRHFKAISDAISTYDDLSLLFSHFVEGFSRAFKIRGASIMLYDEREGQLFRVSSYGISDVYLEKGPLFYDQDQCAFVTGKPLFVDDLQTDPRVQYPEAAAKEGLASMASFPIKCRQAILGIMRMYHSQRIRMHPEDVEAILALCRQLGMAVEYNGLKNFLDMVKGAMGNLPLRMLEGL